MKKNKKILIIMLGITLIIYFLLLLSNNRKYINHEKSIEVASVPSTGKVVILDARTWRRGSDGAVSEFSNISESDINLQIVLKIQKLLEQSGTTVILTRSDERAIYNLDSHTLREKKISDIKNRVKIGNESSADIFVSVHLNKISQQQYYGWQCFYKNKNEKSKKLAEVIQSNLNQSIQKENNRIAMKIGSVYIVKKVEIPISIVECGFLSNKQEEQELQTEEYQQKLAWGIYNGINDYFNL